MEEEEKFQNDDSEDIDLDESDSLIRKKSQKIIAAKIKGNSVVIEDHQDARIIYDNGYYGVLNEDKSLNLNFEEALHLMERNLIKTLDENGLWLEVSDCARIFTEREKNFWTDYLVFKDLRNRGYIVGRGITAAVKYRLYPRGAKIGTDVAKIMIAPLAEGSTINLQTLDEIVTQTQSLKKKLLIACVDRLGDVSYYELLSLFK